MHTNLPKHLWRAALAAAGIAWLVAALPTTALAASHGYRVIAEIAPSRGGELNGEPLQGPEGQLYLTARSGGEHGHGAVLQVGASGEVSVLHAFRNRRDGGAPASGLVRGADGWLYGSTRSGGEVNQGALYKMSPQGRFKPLYSFRRFEDGAFPGKLLLASDGNFYGTTESGGATERGTVFRLTPQGVFTVIHHFSGLPADPAQPVCELIQARDGLLYGTSLDGGGQGAGTLFRIGLDGRGLTVLHRFMGDGHEGRFPTTALLQAGDGNFYGTTSSTGFDIGNTGAAYRLTPQGEFTLLRLFDAELDGAQPQGTLIQGSDGDFYGTTTTGGPVAAAPCFA